MTNPTWGKYKKKADDDLNSESAICKNAEAQADCCSTESARNTRLQQLVQHVRGRKQH